MSLRLEGPEDDDPTDEGDVINLAPPDWWLAVVTLDLGTGLPLLLTSNDGSVKLLFLEEPNSDANLDLEYKFLY